MLTFMQLGYVSFKVLLESINCSLFFFLLLLLSFDVLIGWLVMLSLVSQGSNGSGAGHKFHFIRD